MKFSDNHTNEQIPENELVSGPVIAQIYIGVAITLPAFLVASEVFSNLGLVSGMIALGVSGVLLFVLSSLTMSVGASLRLSTYSIISAVFGSWVAKFINTILAITLLGWFAVTVSLFAQALNDALFQLANIQLSTLWTKVIGGLVMTGLTLFGFKMIDRLSRLVVPALALVLIISFVLILRTYSWEDLISYTNETPVIASVGAAVSIIIGAFMVGITIAPDMSRFAKSRSHGVLASFLSYGTGTQIVLLLAGIPVLVTLSKDFVANLTLIGFGWPAFFVVVLATLTTNINNLYSVSLSFGQTFSKIKDYQITAVTGIIGTILAAAGFETVFVPFLLFLSVTIPPIAGIYVVHWWMNRDADFATSSMLSKGTALAAWIIGSGVAILSLHGVLSLTTAPAINAIVTAVLVYALASMFARPLLRST